MSDLQEMTGAVGRVLQDLSIQDTLSLIGIVALLAAFGVLRWRLNVQNSRRLNAAIAAYVSAQFSQSSEGALCTGDYLGNVE
jgi:hypothetical protein